METIKATTKKGARWIEAYNNSTADCLADVYGRYSFEKGRAEALCKKQMESEGGEDFRIMGANCMQFTCGWRVPGGLRLETACHSYIVK